MSKWLLVILASSLSCCGVKGPPEPPLPTEASLKKESRLQEPPPGVTEDLSSSKKPKPKAK